MPERTTTCRVCGLQLEGRDVYEGICASCREEEILAGTQLPKGPPAPRRRPEPQPPHPPPAARKAGIDMDADTKELLALNDVETEVELDRRRPNPAPPAEPVEEGVIRFTDTEPTERVILPRPPLTATQPATRGADTLALPAEADDELPVTEVAEAPTAKLPANAERRVLPALEHTPPDLSLLEGAGDHPAAAPRTIEPPRAPRPQVAPPPEADRPPPIRLELDAPTPGPERPEAASPAKTERKGPAPMASRQLEVDLSIQFSRLLDQLQQLSRRLEVGAVSLTPRQQVWFGFRAFFGFVLGLGALAVVVVGVMGLIGLAFHPPLLEMLRRAVHGLFGG